MTVKLNSRQRRSLASVLPHDGMPNLLGYLESDSSRLHGLEIDEILRDLSELERMNLIKVDFSNEEETDVTVTLSSDAASYFADRRMETAKTFARYAFQLVVGASGGLVALVAQSLLSD